MIIAKTILGLFLAAATAVTLSITAPDARAETAAPQVCLPRAEAVTQLRDQHRESAAALGVIKDGRAIVEVFASPIGTWTAFFTDADGQSCILATGHHWTPTPVLAGSGS